MKKAYIVAAACVLVGAAGFSSIYVMNQTEQKQEELVQNKEQLEENQEIEIGSNTITDSELLSNQVAEAELEPSIEGTVNSNDDSLAELELDDQNQAEEMEVADGQESPSESKEAEVGTIEEEVLHFNPEKGVMWPIEGSVLLDYSMDATIFFPTLQQYQYNPAMVLSAQVNDKVYFIAKGKITNIETNEVTGCTVTQDVGDGYTAVYGQLKELNFEVGDMVQSGQVVGYVSEPTKYYSVEGSNVYFQLLKDGVPVDPEEVLP